MSEPQQPRSPRVARSVIARYRKADAGQHTWLVSPLRDLSSKGARFLSERPEEVGWMLEMQLVLPNAPQPVAVPARIVWTRPAQMGLLEVGVAFVPSNPETQKAIDAAVAAFLGKLH